MQLACKRPAVPHCYAVLESVLASVALSALSLACSESQGPASSEPRGLIVAGGQNAAFLGDTFRLGTWFVDSTERPLGIPPEGVVWSSADSSTVDLLRDRSIVARALGRATLTATATHGGRRFEVSHDVHVVERIRGRLAWVRQPYYRAQVRLVYQDDVAGPVLLGPEFGYPGGPHGQPAISPDGRYVAVAAIRPRSPIAPAAVYLVDLERHTARCLTDTLPGDQVVPRWLPDGRTIAFASDAGGSWNIWTVDSSGGSVRKRLQLNLPRLPVFDVSRTDGSLVVAVPTDQRGEDLWEATLDGGLGRRITDTPAIGKWMPRLSPDGRWIAYGATRLVPREGGVPRELLPTPYVPGFLAAPSHTFPAGAFVDGWTSDSRFLLVTWHVDAQRIPQVNPEVWAYPGDIYAVSTDGRIRIRLTSWELGDVQADHRR